MFLAILMSTPVAWQDFVTCRGPAPGKWEPISSAGSGEIWRQAGPRAASRGKKPKVHFQGLLLPALGFSIPLDGKTRIL